MEAVCLKSRLQSWLLWIVRHKRHLFVWLGVFVVVEDWPESFVVIGAIWIVWKSSLGYWPCWGIIPDVFLYTAVKQEVEPKPKIDLNHCFVKNQNWTWIIVVFWLHWIQLIIGHSWIQPQLKPNWKKQTLTTLLNRWDFESQEPASCNECSWCYLYANSNFILLCIRIYVYVFMKCCSVYQFILMKKAGLQKHHLLLNWKINDRLKKEVYWYNAKVLANRCTVLLRQETRTSQEA